MVLCLTEPFSVLRPGEQGTGKADSPFVDDIRLSVEEGGGGIAEITILQKRARRQDGLYFAAYRRSMDVATSHVAAI